MKKIIIVLVMVLGLMLPFYVKAETKSLNLKEALEEEKIELDKGWESYSENDDQAIIYLFRGNGCGYCRAFLTFLNSIVGDYGKYFKVVSYEVWYNQENAALMDSVSNYLGNPAQGVPYIVIGDKVFAGYAESYNDDIKSTIKTLYETKKGDRYDVMKEMEENPNKEDRTTIKTITKNIVLATIVATIVIIGTNIAFVNYKFNELKDSKETKETKKETKEVEPKKANKKK